MTGTAQCKPSHQPPVSSHLETDICPSTFLKRKGGLFKKAHELSVLCSVDVAVFIFGNNKKLYEYSSADMHELITRYTYVSSAFCGNPTTAKPPLTPSPAWRPQ